MKQVNKQQVMEYLWSHAEYAVKSYSKELIYETLGALRMAVELKAVTYDDVIDIDSYLTHDHLNNGAYMRELYRKGR